MRVLALYWLPMAMATLAILWCAALLVGRTTPRLYQALPILKDLEFVLAIVFALGLLIPDNRAHLVAAAVFGSLLVAALAVLPWHLVLRLLGIGVLLAAGVVWGVWTNWVTADIFAVALILASLNLAMQISRSFWGWSFFGIVNVAYDIFTSYIVDTQTAPSRDVVVHASPQALVVGSVLGSLDVAVPGTIIMVAATIAYRHKRIALLYGGLTGYLAGFAGCEAVFALTGGGVAAMMTLFPATMAGVLIAAWRTGLLREFAPRTVGNVDPAEIDSTGSAVPAKGRG